MSVNTVVQAPVDVIWQVLTDFQRWPDWSSEFTSVVVAGPLAPGGTFSWQRGTTPFTATLTEVVPPTEVTWEVRRHGVVATQRTSIGTDSDDKGCVVTVDERWTGWLARMMPGVVFTKVVGAGLTKGLVSLKSEAERVHRVRPV